MTEPPPRFTDYFHVSCHENVVALERVTNENTNTDIRWQIILHKKDRVT